MTIVLNMIVRDEAKIIRDTLENFLGHVKLGAWLIHDTGSCDETPEIVEQFFSEKSIPGRLVKREWSDFATNRQWALDDAREFDWCDWALILDADDRVSGKLVPEMLNKPRFRDVTGITFKQQFRGNRAG